MTDNEPKVYRGKLSDFTPLQDNPNDGTERGQYMLEESAQKFAAWRSIAATSDDVIPAGNHFSQVFGAEVSDDVIVVETDGQQLVVVKRTDISSDDPRAMEYAVVDNRTSEIGLSWSAEELQRISEDTDIDLGKWFYEDELAEIMGDLENEPPEDAGAQVDRAEELREQWQTERGQVWVIPSKSVPGKSHRVMCGDSTSAEDVALLMGGAKADAVIADPPYGMNLDTDWQNRVGTWERATKSYRAIENDDRPFDRRGVPVEAVEEFWFGADYYIDTLPSFGKGGSWLVWDKRQAGSIDDMRGNAFELCWSKNKHRREVLRFVWIGVLGHNKLLDGRIKYHPTLKPVIMISYIISTWCGAIILDPFLGSGTTAVAAEQTGRLAYGMEISEAYCAVILQRLTDLGLEPIRADG